jgi:hypothetical protein
MAIIYRPKQTSYCKLQHLICLSSLAMECLFNSVWIKALEKNLRAGKDEISREVQWPKATCWLVTHLSVLTLCFHSPLQLTWSSMEGWRELLIMKFLTDKISPTFNQHVATVKPSLHFFITS